MARILVADTDKSVRDLVRMRLTAWGHDVASFATGLLADAASVEREAVPA